MTREWIALERAEGRGQDLSLYARALHAQLHRWVDGDGRIPTTLAGDLPEMMGRVLAYRYGASRSDRRLLAAHLRELVEVGGVILSADGLELRSLADGELVRHRPDREPSTTVSRSLTIEQRPVAMVSRSVTNEPRSVTNEPRSETKSDLSARNDSGQVSTVEDKRRQEKTVEEKREKSACASASAHAPASAREGLLEEPPKAPARAAKARAAATPLPDPVPAAGTPARRLYDAITQDRVLGPITRGPGDLAERLSQVDAYPGIDVLAEVRRAGAWVAGKPAGHWSDGRKALLGWLARTAERAAATPKAAPSVTKGPVPSCSREDYPWHEAEIDWFAPTNGGGQ